MLRDGCTGCTGNHRRDSRDAARETYPFQYHLLVVAPLHEQDDLPAGVAVDGVHLKQDGGVRHTQEAQRASRRGNEDKRSAGVKVT